MTAKVASNTGYSQTMNAVEIRTKSHSRYLEIRQWCVEQFGEPGNYADDTWVSRESVFLGYAMFYFQYEKNATWFMLRWQ